MAQCLILGDQKDAGERNRSQKVKTGSQFWVTGDDECTLRKGKWVKEKQKVKGRE